MAFSSSYLLCLTATCMLRKSSKNAPTDWICTVAWNPMRLVSGLRVAHLDICGTQDILPFSALLLICHIKDVVIVSERRCLCSVSLLHLSSLLVSELLDIPASCLHAMPRRGQQIPDHVDICGNSGHTYEPTSRKPRAANVQHPRVSKNSCQSVRAVPRFSIWGCPTPG